MTVTVDAANETLTEVFLPRPRRRAPWTGRIGRAVAVYASPLVLLVAWQLVSSLGVISDTIAASPVQVVKAAVHLWQVGAPSTLGEDLRISLTRAAVGLVIGVSLACVAATVAGLSRAAELVFNGPVSILNTIPFLALLPVMIMWFGIGEVSKVLLISLGAGIPMYLNLFGAIRNVDAGLVEMARAAGAGRGRLIIRVLLPGALPGALVGLRFSLAYSVLGLVVAEQINANSGIGFMITQAQTYQRVDEMFLGLVIYALLGLAGDQIVRVLERAVLRWRPELEGRA
jgi:sulfonate transport system permease protein